MRISKGDQRALRSPFGNLRGSLRSRVLLAIELHLRQRANGTGDAGDRPLDSFGDHCPAQGQIEPAMPAVALWKPSRTPSGLMLSIDFVQIQKSMNLIMADIAQKRGR